MKEVDVFTMTDVATKGMLPVVKSAIENGYSLISRNSEYVALVMPLNITGLNHFNKRMLELTLNDDAPSEVHEIFRMYKILLDKFSAEA